MTTERAATDLLSMLASPNSPPAVVSDEHDRIVLWNRGAAELLGRPAGDVLGRHCFEVLAGRDGDGRPVCEANCPVKASVAAVQTVATFPMHVACGAGARRLVRTTILGTAAAQPGPLLVVHLFEPVVPTAPARPWPAPARLTRREQEVLHYIASGLQNKEVARALAISPATVRNHVQSLLRKLRVRSKLAAVSLALRNGWMGGSTEVRGV